MQWLSGFLAFGILAISLPGNAAAQQKRIYLANDDHTDFLWSSDQETQEKAFVDLIDFHLKLADETAGNEPAFRDRFNCDGSYWLWTYEHRKTPAEFDHLMARVKDGTISTPLTTLVSCYGGQPAEAVLRGMYYSGRLERRFGLRFPLVAAMENQVLPLGLTSLFAGAGAQYSWRGVCGCASKLDNKTVLFKRPREIYWWTGHDGQRLLLKWYSLGSNSIGTYTEAGAPYAAMKFVETDPGFLERYTDPKTHEPYQVIGLFGFGGDDLERKTGVQPPPKAATVPGLHTLPSSSFCEHFHIIAAQQSNAKRKIIVSNEWDFFEDFQHEHGASLDSASVTYGNEWDLYSASMVETSARAKRTVEKLRAAEMLSTLVSLKYPAFVKSFAAQRDQAFNDLGLYWEHDWTADGAVSRAQRAAWEEELVTGAESYVNSLEGEALIRFGGMIPRPANANRFFVLNQLGWPRTEAADFAYAGSADLHVRDLTSGQDVPHQLIKLDGISYLRILAGDVPAAGYKVYEIQSGNDTAATDPAASVSDGSMENDAVKLAVERDGAIRSFIDKKRGNTELAATIGDLKLNDFAAKLDDGEPLTVENSGPVSVTLRARSQAGLAHTTAVTLYRNSDRVDISNELLENFSDVRYWSFGFDLPNPATHTEEVGSINLNKLQSAGGDYADSHARYDHITVNHFADLTDGTNARGVTISNPDLAFARLGNSTVSSLDTQTAQLNLLAGGQVDGRSLGIQGQNGQTHFLQRFALRAHASYDPAAAMKFALEHQNPFVTGAVISKDGGTYPDTSYSLLTVGDPNVLLWALKPHEDGIEKGVTARLWNLSEKPVATEITFTPGIATAMRTTHVETDLEPGSVSKSGGLAASFAREQMETFRLQPPPAAPQ